MNIRIAPCKDCSERNVGCHSICEKYKSWKNDLDAIKKNRFNKLQSDDIYNRHHWSVMRKASRHISNYRQHNNCS